MRGEVFKFGRDGENQLIMQALGVKHASQKQAIKRFRPK